MSGEEADAGEMEFDEQHRPVAIDDGYTRWEFGYGGCANAELATARFVVVDLLTAVDWEFVRPPAVGDSGEALYDWTRARHPLDPM